MSNREIAKDILVAFLSHESIAQTARGAGGGTTDPAEIGKWIGNIFKEIHRAVEQGYQA